MALLDGDEVLPETLPEGYDYFIYEITDEKKSGYGCFIGENPDDFQETDAVHGFTEGANVRVARVGRAEFVDFWETLEAAKLEESARSVQKDSPAA